MGSVPLNLLTFPLWWYSTGFALVRDWVKRQTRYGLQATGLLLFASHIREPLFGDYTRSGIIVGFFLRLVLLGFKLVWFGLRELYLVTLAALYLLSIPLTVVMILYQLFPA